MKPRIGRTGSSWFCAYSEGAGEYAVGIGSTPKEAWDDMWRLWDAFMGRRP